MSQPQKPLGCWPDPNLRDGLRNRGVSLASRRVSRQLDIQTLEDDLRRLGALVNGAALASGLHNQTPGEFRILNLACGECHESGL